MARRKRPQIEVLERGDIFFLYRPRVATEHVRGREDVQRFFLVLAPDAPDGGRRYRLFVVGRKKLPEVHEGEQHPEERNWAVNALTTRDPEALHAQLAAVRYSTKTRGERVVGEARPVGEGRYALVRHAGHTELAYALELPEEPGPAQADFEVRKEAAYLVAVKNPSVTAPGFPAGDQGPRYPARLARRFGKRRWIDVSDPALLDYEGAQILLLGAHAGAVRDELGLEIDEEHETAASAEIFRDLHLPRQRPSLRLLLEGRFPPSEELDQQEPTPVAAPSGPGQGRATLRAPSAAALTRMLGGIRFPKRKQGLVDYASRHRDRVESASELLDTLRAFPDREYRNMADVARAFGRVR